MTLPYSIEINLICLIVFVLILVNYKISGQQMLEFRAFRRILLCFIPIILLDIGSKLTTFYIENCKHWTLFFDCCTLTAAIFVPYFWLNYVYYKTHNSSYKLQKWKIPLAVPLIVMQFLAIVEFILGLSVLDDQVSVSTKLWPILNGVSIFYIITASTIALRRYQQSKSESQKAECLYLAFIVVIPIISLIVQSFEHNHLIVTPVFTLTLLHIYIIMQKKQISIDQLTGLNNEFRLKSYLEYKAEKFNPSQRLFIVMLSLSNLSSIQKNLGKGKAIEAIKQTSSILKAFCMNQNVFLARYKYDKFAMVLEKDNFTDVEAFCKNLSLSGFNTELDNDIDQQVSYSIQWSEYGTQKTPNIEALLKDIPKNNYKS